MARINVGDIVIPNLRGISTKLILWEEIAHDDGCSKVAAELDENTILTVVKIEKINSGLLNPEWKDSSCLLLGPLGIMGWVGAGWVKKLPSNSSASCKSIRDKRNLNS